MQDDSLVTNVMSVIDKMKGDTLGNYIVPGLDSSVLEGGKVRIFQSSRDSSGLITPHNHRFNFCCYVLRGWVCNRTYELSDTADGGDLFIERVIEYKDSPGKYDVLADSDSSMAMTFTTHDESYHAGDWYFMENWQYHSITFSRDAIVVFFEGPQISEISSVLLPVVDDKVIDTLRTEPWMFQRKPSND